MDIFVPDVYAQNIYTINYQKLKKKGIKCLLFDLNNTLTSYDNDYPDKSLIELFHELENNFKLIIVSNSNKDRIRPFKEKLNVDSSFASKKPFKKKLKKILNLYDFKDTEIAMIGDEIITDIWGGNKMGFTTILVNSVSNEMPIHARIIKRIDKHIIKKLNKKDILTIGEYYE